MFIFPYTLKPQEVHPQTVVCVSGEASEGLEEDRTKAQV